MSIVCGTKLSPESEGFAEVAGLFARRLGVPLRLVHVCEDPRAPVVLGTDEESILGPLREALSRESERLSTVLGIEVQPHLASGAVVEALVSVAEWELAELLLVGESSASSRNPLGGLSERIAAKSPVPVIALRDAGRIGAWLRGNRALRVLVGADHGRAAQAARSFAAGLGRCGPCEVEVVRVASPREEHLRLGFEPPLSEHALSEEANDALLRELARMAPPDEQQAAVRVLAARGSADAHLTALADQGDFDLVVVGQRGRSFIERLWAGSVARGVLHAAPVSVACVPVGPGPDTAAFRPPRIVVAGVDFSESDARVLAQALGLTAEGGVVHLAHVLVPGVTAEATTAREQAWYRLSKLVDVDGDGSDIRRAVETHILEGVAAEQLLALAARVGADLIVLGVRSRLALGRALLGSVARETSEGARVPVLLVPLAPL